MMTKSSTPLINPGPPKKKKETPVKNRKVQRKILKKKYRPQSNHYYEFLPIL